MYRSFGKPPEASPKAIGEASEAATQDAWAEMKSAQPQSWKHGVIAGIAAFAALSFLLSSMALRSRPDHLADANAPSPSEVLQFSSSLSSQYELIERELGPAPEAKQPSPQETAQFIKEMPDRFADVAARLEAHSGRAARDGDTPQKPAKPRNISTQDVGAMAANARRDFKEVNAALGVSSTIETPATGAIPWSDLGSVSLDEISPAEKQKIATEAIAQTAAAFQQILPMEDAPGVSLFAVEAARTVMHSRYRISKDMEPADQNEAGRALRRRACLGATMDMTLRLGGRYEYVLYDADGLVVDRFTITENSCA